MSEPRNNAHPVTNNLVRVGNQLHPITHSFVVRPRLMHDVRIFEFYNSYSIYSAPMLPNVDPLPLVPGMEGATTINDSVAIGQRSYQGAEVLVWHRLADGHWQWNFFPMSDVKQVLIRLNARPDAFRSWVDGAAVLGVDSPDGPRPQLYEYFDAIQWADNMWHPPSRPMNIPFPHNYVPFEGWTPPWTPWGPSHAWMFMFNGWGEDIERVDYVFWIRGPASLPWPTNLRNMHINDDLFPPGGSSSWWPESRIRRLSPEWYERPWERYPHLM